MSKERSLFIDILKAIGIISIVIGHSSWTIAPFNLKIGPFVYSYHIMIFMFTAGYCFKEEYASEPYAYIGKKIKNLFPLYVLYNVVFVCIHNFLIIFNVLSKEDWYSIKEILVKILNSLTFVTSEKMLGTFWFIPVLLMAEVIFVISFSFATKFGKYKIYMMLLISIFIGALGLILNTKNVYLQQHIQTSLLAVPILYMGYGFKYVENTIRKCCSWWSGILSAIVLYNTILKSGTMIELSINSIIHPLFFYPITILGIYFCMCIAAIIERFSFINRVMSYIGKNSFHIMALHFCAIKIVDIIYCRIIGLEDLAVLAVFPYSFNIWPVYYVAGVVLPLIVVYPFQQINKYVKNMIRRDVKPINW